jgi:hypothetical protein
MVPTRVPLNIRPLHEPPPRNAGFTRQHRADDRTPPGESGAPHAPRFMAESPTPRTMNATFNSLSLNRPLAVGRVTPCAPRLDATLTASAARRGLRALPLRNGSWSSCATTPLPSGLPMSRYIGTPDLSGRTEVSATRCRMNPAFRALPRLRGSSLGDTRGGCTCLLLRDS